MQSALLVVLLGIASVLEQPVTVPTSETSEPADWSTNAPAVFRAGKPMPVFDHYLANSLHHHVWTNLVAHTNGKSTLIWSKRSHPEGWPAMAPVVEWNRDSLIWGMRGMTALSPCWEGEGSCGQAPITALTRRHGYTRGHGIGQDGMGRTRKGQKAWFVTTNNSIVEVTLSREMIRTPAGGASGDYTVFLFNKDLPESIEPMRVISATNFTAKYRMRPLAPWPLFKSEQSGHVSAEIPGFTVNTWKGGDSGSPNMLPLPGELVFVGGRSTTGPTDKMQADMDALCAAERLNPKKYQMQWVDVSAY